MSCTAKTPDPDGTLWRTRVERLAREFATQARETAADFNWERRCDTCGCAHATNTRIYADTEPFSCGDSLYDPTPPRRDGYWYACALNGVDPDRSGRWRTPLWHWRRRLELRRRCAEVGLVFGSVPLRRAS